MANQSIEIFPWLRALPLTTRFRLLGILPLMFFCFQAVHYWRIQQLGNMLWMCNIGNLLLALGLFIDQPALIRVAVVWSIPGFLVWFRYVVLEYGIFPSSTLAHVGGLLVALVWVRKVGMDRAAWIYSFAWYLILQVVSRLATPVELNVNVSQGIYGSWQSAFRFYWLFWLVMTFVVASIVWLLVFLLNKLWPPVSDRPRSEFPEALP